MKFAFLIMGNFDNKADRAAIHGDTAQIIGVADIQEACAAARELYSDGIDCIELCGAFGADGAKEIVKVTENKIPVGYVTHLPEQDKVYKAVFQDG
jgi:2-keto-3-deoxy-6-phosphogluconate aldolase